MTEISTQSLDLLFGNVGEDSIRKLASSAAGLDRIEKALKEATNSMRGHRIVYSSDNRSIRDTLSTIYLVCCEQARVNKPESARAVALAFGALSIEVSIMINDCSKLPDLVSSAISDWQRPIYEQISPVAAEIQAAWKNMRQLREKNFQIVALGSPRALMTDNFSNWIHPTFMAVNKLALALWNNLPKNKDHERYVPKNDLGQSYKLVRDIWLLLTGQEQR